MKKFKLNEVSGYNPEFVSWKGILDYIFKECDEVDIKEYLFWRGFIDKDGE